MVIFSTVKMTLPLPTSTKFLASFMTCFYKLLIILMGCTYYRTNQNPRLFGDGDVKFLRFIFILLQVFFLSSQERRKYVLFPSAVFIAQRVVGPSKSMKQIIEIEH